MSNPTERRLAWRRWLAVGGLLMLVSLPMFIAGIWVDGRWAGTAGLFFVPGLICLIAATINLENL